MRSNVIGRCAHSTSTISNSNFFSFPIFCMMLGLFREKMLWENVNGIAAKFVVFFICLHTHTKKPKPGENSIKISVEILVISIVSFYFFVTMCCWCVSYSICQCRHRRLLLLRVSPLWFRLLSVTYTVCLKLRGILCEMEFRNNFCVSLCSVLFRFASSSSFHFTKGIKSKKKKKKILFASFLGKIVWVLE